MRQTKCYRFYWGGCQGNGNRFENRDDCENYCKLNLTSDNSRYLIMNITLLNQCNNITKAILLH